MQIKVKNFSKFSWCKIDWRQCITKSKLSSVKFQQERMTNYPRLNPIIWTWIKYLALYYISWTSSIILALTPLPKLDITILVWTPLPELTIILDWTGRPYSGLDSMTLPGLHFLNWTPLLWTGLHITWAPGFHYLNWMPLFWNGLHYLTGTPFPEQD